MTLACRFQSFQVTPDGKTVIYTGVTADQQEVAITQPAADLDVMLVLIASVLEKALTPEIRDSGSHRTQSFMVEPAEQGGVVLSLISHDITRSFHLPSALAGQLCTQINTTLRQSRLRVVN
jgi:hypothetical protein